VIRARVGFAGLIAWCIAGAASAQSPTRPRTLAEDLQLFSQVLNQIRVNHVDSTDAHRLMMAAISGALGAADPHSYVLPATKLSPQFERWLEAGKLATVPIAFTVTGGTAVVTSVSPGSDAAKQGIVRGDVLLAADSTPVVATHAEALSYSLSGERGTSALLRFERERLDGSRSTFEKRVTRQPAGAESAVLAATMLDATTGYIRVTTFNVDRVHTDFAAAMTRLSRAGMLRLVLDLRDNGGGLVDEASRMAGAFLPSGKMVFTSTGRRTDVIDTGYVSRSWFRTEYSEALVVLVNEGTASASELFAGAMQDHDRASIVGRPTFGKALLMRGFPLTDGSVLMLVVGQLRTPCGRIIQRAYREIAVGDYYRSAGVDRDRAARPSCRTVGGRTVYGGGGVFPDVVLARPDPLPRWAATLIDDDVISRWAAAWQTSSTTAIPTLDAFVADSIVPPAMMASVRSFARDRGVPIPENAQFDAVIGPHVRLALARQRWGEDGYYRVAVSIDEEIRAAHQVFGGKR
jgi:carboxyl-terminal processing protease